MICTCEQHSTKGLTINAMLKGDPTRTLTLRSMFEANMVRRFKKVRRDIVTSIDTNDCFGLKALPHDLTVFEAIPSRQFAFQRDAGKINGFMEWLQEQMDNDILELLSGQQIGNAVETAWTNTYIQTAYQKGIIRARNELINAGYPVPALEDPFAGVQVAFNQPFHLDRVGLIYTRTYRGLKGITDEMDKQISSTLAQGLAEGKNPNVIARELASKVGKMEGFTQGPMDAITRARTLARTEVIRAHHMATIQEYKNWGVAGVKVQAEWVTAGFNVCPLCSPLEGKIYTLDKIEGMIPRHPN